MSEQRRDNVLDLLPNAKENLRSMLTIIREQRDLLTSLGHPQNFIARQHNGLWLFQRDNRPAPSPSQVPSPGNIQQQPSRNTVSWSHLQPGTASERTSFPPLTTQSESTPATLNPRAPDFRSTMGAESLGFGEFQGDLTAPRNPYQPVSSANFSNEQGWDNPSRGTTNTWVGHRPTQMDYASAWMDDPLFQSPVGVGTGGSTAPSNAYFAAQSQPITRFANSPASQLRYPSAYTGLDRSRTNAANEVLATHSRGNSRETNRFRPYQIRSESNAEPVNATHQASGSQSGDQTEAPIASDVSPGLEGSVEEEEAAGQPDENAEGSNDANTEGGSDLDAEGDTE